MGAVQPPALQQIFQIILRHANVWEPHASLPQHRAASGKTNQAGSKSAVSYAPDRHILFKHLTRR